MMNRQIGYLTVGGLVLLLAATASMASEWRDLPASIQGFGTIGATYSDQGDADFVGSLLQPNGAGHTRRVTGSVDSKLGVQLDAELSPMWSAVVQGISRYRHDGSFDPGLEWAFIQYQPSPDFSVRAGRFVTLHFMESQSRLVSYSYAWVRPPTEVYDLNPITNKTGIDVRYQLSLGEAVNSFTASWGVAEEDFPTGGSIDADDTWEFEYKVEYHSTTARLALVTAEFDLKVRDLDNLAAGFDAFANTDNASNRKRAAANARLLHSDGVRNNFLSVGVLHQPGQWLLRGELVKTFPDDAAYTPDATGGYLTGGYRIAAFTPFATLAAVSSERKSSPPLNTEGMSMEQAAAAEQLNAALSAAIDVITTKQRSVSAGLRWDLQPGLAVKFQYTHLRTESGSGNPGRLAQVQPGFEPGDSANIFSLNMDFVF